MKNRRKLQEEQDKILIEFFIKSRSLENSDQIAEHKKKLLKRVNEFRKRNGLPTVDSFNSIYLYVIRNPFLNRKCGSWGR